MAKRFSPEFKQQAIDFKVGVFNQLGQLNQQEIVEKNGLDFALAHMQQQHEESE